MHDSKSKERQMIGDERRKGERERQKPVGEETERGRVKQSSDKNVFVMAASTLCWPFPSGLVTEEQWIRSY